MFVLNAEPFPLAVRVPHYENGFEPHAVNHLKRAPSHSRENSPAPVRRVGFDKHDQRPPRFCIRGKTAPVASITISYDTEADVVEEVCIAILGYKSEVTT